MPQPDTMPRNLSGEFWAIYPPALAKLLSPAHGRDVPGPMQVREALSGRQSQAQYPVAGGVAVINISGVMTKYADWETAYYGGAVHTELEQAVKAATADPNVKAILLRIDSPGGSVAGASDLADAIFAARAQKPVCAYISDLAASCGYYMASQCQTIYSDSDALVGCIGTISVLYDLSKMLEDYGIKAFVFTSEKDPHKGTGVPGSPITPEQQAYVQQMVDDLGAQFIADVHRGRPGLRGRMDLPDGRVHVASKALAMGMIDGIKSFDRCLADLQNGTDPLCPTGGGDRRGPTQRNEGGSPALLGRKLDLDREG